MMFPASDGIVADLKHQSKDLVEKPEANKTEISDNHYENSPDVA